MNKILRTLIIGAALICAVSPAVAQSAFRDTVVSYVVDSGASVGGDYWFALPSNYGEGIERGSYINIYISSSNNTTAYVQIGENGSIKGVPVPALGVATYNVPFSMEMESSGIVENKAIHVFDKTDDISVNFMSHQPYTSDGSDVLPTSAWGRDYVVASYQTNINDYAYGVNLPSEFTISAADDNTRVDITPSFDCRQITTPNENVTNAAYPRGKKFTVVLNRGQSIEFEATYGASNDITGTVIHSNQPIGVIGASQCPDIPVSYGYCDFICHSLLPISSWGKTYYSTSFIQPDTLPAHEASMYLIVSSKDSQTIHRYNCDSGDHIECTIDTALGIRWVEEAKANKWYSDAPFMLVLYINGSTYPDGNSGSGDPAEVALDPKENYLKSVLFIVADSIAPQLHYDNYANIFYYDSAAKSTMLDSINILKYSSTCLGDSMSVAIIPHIKPGAHLVTSDSGVSVYIYGYGYDESYSWSGGMGYRPYTPFKPQDSIPPTIIFSQNGNCIHAAISDSGSGLAEIYVDSTFNMSVKLDTTFVQYDSTVNSSADMCYGAISDFAYARFTVFDGQGNVSIGTVTFSPIQIISSPGFTLSSEGFDTTLAGTSKTLPILNFVDTSTQYSVEIDSILIDGPSFVYYDSIPGNSLPFVLPPKSGHNFSITFEPSDAATYVSHAYAISNGLPVRRVTLTGTGYTPAGVMQGVQSKVSASLTPNPATNSATLNFTILQTSNVTFELSSMDGKTAFQWKSDAESEGQHAETFDLSSLAEGDYIYRFEANNEVTSGKLIIQR